MKYYCTVNIKTGSLFKETIKIEYPDIEFIEDMASHSRDFSHELET